MALQSLKAELIRTFQEVHNWRQTIVERNASFLPGAALLTNSLSITAGHCCHCQKKASSFKQQPKDCSAILKGGGGILIWDSSHSAKEDGQPRGNAVRPTSLNIWKNYSVTLCSNWILKPRDGRIWTELLRKSERWGVGNDARFKMFCLVSKQGCGRGTEFYLIIVFPKQNRVIKSALCWILPQARYENNAKYDAVHFLLLKNW